MVPDLTYGENIYDHAHMGILITLENYESNNITLFEPITMLLCEHIPIFILYLILFHIVLLVPLNIVINLNNVMKRTLTRVNEPHIYTCEACILFGCGPSIR